MSDERLEETFQRLRKEVESTAAEAQRAQGAFDQLTRQLANEFECTNQKEAEALLAKLQRQAAKAKEQFEQQLREYKKKWKDE